MPRGEYLLEVRTEEIPARMVAEGVRELATRLFEELMGKNMAPREVETGYTPRRLMVRFKGLPEVEPDREEEILGPPVQVAFQDDGTPTRALTGFAKRSGVRPEDLKRVRTEKGEYLAAIQRTAGQPAGEILAQLVPQVLRALSWPKTMRWGEGQGPWVRPVHGIVSLFEGEVVEFEFFGVRSGRTTTGHPILSPEAFQVRDGSDYLRKLSRLGIEIRPQERQRVLTEKMAAAAGSLGGGLVEDPALLEKLVAMCEIPGVLQGSFDPQFQELPREVLVASLRDHQSALTVESDGHLLPVFLTVMDRPDDPQGRIRAGNEWVVAARLADARFFYHEDRELPLKERLPRLAHLVFHEKLGSYAEKGERLVALAEALCQELDWADEVGPAVEATRLLKADLTTEMVKEFTSLQGVMGGIYAREEGYPEAVWQAIYDQYLPGSTDDPIPRNRVGKIAALADRLDTLVGIFGVGHVPSGSRDPYGLRRAAQGLVRILLEGELPLDLDLICAKAVRLYGDRLPAGADEILASLRPFFYDRIRHLLGLQGFAYDEIEAALAAGVGDLPDLRARVEALHRVREEPSFLAIVLAAKRIANIIRDQPEPELAKKLLAEEAERDLYQAFQRLRGDVEEAVARRDYEGCLRRIADLAQVLDRFFVEVLVMDENEALRRNRIALLQALHRTLSRTARLTEMVVDKAAHRAKAGAQAVESRA